MTGNQLNPTQIFDLANLAYFAKGTSLSIFKSELDRTASIQLESKTVEILDGHTGMVLPTQSGMGFMVRPKGARQNEVIIATRGTASLSDVGTDLYTISSNGPTGHLVHAGFNQTFKSYVQQLKQFISHKNLGFRPSAIHCMGHSLGGALANLNAAAFAELGFSTYLYTVAAPRVGMIPYAEHLSKKFNPQNVFRVANTVDPVTMLPCFPYLHAPYKFGMYLIEGGSYINPMQHMLGNGYTSMNKKSWAQLESGTKARQAILEQEMRDMLEPIGNKTMEQRMVLGASMFSGKLFRLINYRIHQILRKYGGTHLMPVANHNLGSFTVLDQVAEILIKCLGVASTAKKQVGEVVGMIYKFAGWGHQKAEEITAAVVRWAFTLLAQTLMAIANKALAQFSRPML